MSSPVARQYSAVSQQSQEERIRSVDSGIRVRSADSADQPPQYQDLLPENPDEDPKKRQNARRENMPDVEAMCNPTRGNVKCKIISAVLVVCLAIVIACIADSYHKINEGNVGIYYRHGALKDRVTAPGVHFMLPFVEDYKEVQIRPETYTMEAVKAITKDGIENTFNEITTITRIYQANIIGMTKKFGPEFKKALVFDRIKEELRIFCASHTIDEVYNTKFLDIVETVLAKTKDKIRTLGEDGIEILNLVIPKPEIPLDIARNYKQVKVQWTEQLVATQQQKTERIKKETELIKAVADAERQKSVLEIKIQENIIQKEGEKNVSAINNLIKKEAEENDANILKYRIETEAAANSALYTDQYVKLNLAKQLSNNTKFYFSGEQSSLGSLFSKILN